MNLDKWVLIFLASINVLPVNTFYDSMNCLPGNVVGHCQDWRGLSFCIPLPNFTDNGCSQFRKMIGFAAFPVQRAGLTVPSFAVSVGRIIECRTKEEMVGAHASWVVTCMANHHIFWQTPVRELPSQTVCSLGNSGGRSGHAVSIGIYTTCPQPARIGFLDPRPKMCFLIFDKLGTATTTVSASTSPNVANVSQETLLTCWTNNRSFCVRIKSHGNSIGCRVMRPGGSTPRPHSL